MRVLIACDKFKDCLTAAEACDVVAAAIRRRQPDAVLDVCPITDGGDGFTDVLTRTADGNLCGHDVHGPRGAPVKAVIGRVNASRAPAVIRARLRLADDATIAVIAMADASGLALLPPALRDVWRSDTRGTGELIHIAADADAIVLGIGGSATHDLGVGALTSLGLTPVDATGGPVSPTPEHWSSVARFHGAVVKLPRLFIACDVTNPLLGSRGAAAAYGPQKGLRPGDVAKLDHESARMAMLLCHRCGKPDALIEERGAGAAGGLGFGLRVAANAELVPGFEFVCEWLDLDRRIAAADVVITGEGRFDESSASGKGPAGVVERGLAAGKTVHVFAGAVTGSGADTSKFAAHGITPAGVPLERALREARTNLAGAVERVFAK